MNRSLATMRVDYDQVSHIRVCLYLLDAEFIACALGCSEVSADLEQRIIEQAAQTSRPRASMRPSALRKRKDGSRNHKPRVEMAWSLEASSVAVECFLLIYFRSVHFLTIQHHLIFW